MGVPDKSTSHRVHRCLKSTIQNAKIVADLKICYTFFVVEEKKGKIGKVSQENTNLNSFFHLIHSGCLG